MIGDEEHVLWGPALLANGRTIVKTIELDVQQGRQLVFGTAVGPSGNALGDALSWDITIEYIER